MPSKSSRRTFYSKRPRRLLAAPATLLLPRLSHSSSWITFLNNLMDISHSFSIPFLYYYSISTTSQVGSPCLFGLSLVRPVATLFVDGFMGCLFIATAVFPLLLDSHTSGMIVCILPRTLVLCFGVQCMLDYSPLFVKSTTDAEKSIPGLVRSRRLLVTS